MRVMLSSQGFLMEFLLSNLKFRIKTCGEPSIVLIIVDSVLLKKCQKDIISVVESRTGTTYSHRHCSTILVRQRV